MSVPLIQAPLLTERHSIRSGPIERNGFADYGVIFSTRKGGSPSDFHPSDLLGATIEVLDLQKQGEANRFFTILGGYYCERNPEGVKGTVAISQIFGVAEDAALGFGLVPGDHCLVDEWEMKDLSGGSRRNMMDERSKGEDGWTFIVNFKPFRHQYPFSGKFMGLTRECPQLLDLTIYEASANDEFELAIAAHVSLANGPSRGFRWNWGDGSPEETTLLPTATHTYPKALGRDLDFVISCTSIGPEGCISSLSRTWAVPGYCPVWRIGNTEVSYPGLDTAQFIVGLAGDHVPGTTYRWDWGDGSETEQTTVPNASHSYPRKTDERTFTINVSSSGPGNCTAALSTKATIEPLPCPEISSLTAEEGEMDGNVFLVRFQVNMRHGTPDSFRWNWGDGSDEIVTTVPEASHAFAASGGLDIRRTVKVTATGPGASCVSDATVLVEVPGVCPIISVSAKVADLQPGDAQVSLNLHAIGPKPDRFRIDWGDGSPQSEGTGTQASHTYARPAGDQRSFNIQVSTFGPGTCDQQAVTQVLIPGVCPALSQVQAEWLSHNGLVWTLQASVTLVGPSPDRLLWEWGDGSAPEQSLGTSLSHDYQGRAGESSPVILKVTAVGPASCLSSLTLPVEIPALPCPLLSQLKVVPQALVEDSFSVAFEASYQDPKPSVFRWNWGDGSPEEQTIQPVAIHSFAAVAGEEKSYRVVLRSQGPGACESESHAVVPIPAYCPVPDGLVLELIPADNDSGWIVKANITSAGPAPTTFSWNWGDGSSPEQTSTPSATHEYATRAGEPFAATVTVLVAGPGTCGPVERKGSLLIPARCPVFQPLTVKEISRTVTLVNYEFFFGSSLPASAYYWNFGDGSAVEETTTPQVTHEFARWAGQSPTYFVSVRTEGPGICQGNGEVSLVVPMAEACPVISRIDTYVESETVDTVSIGFVPVTQVGAPQSYDWDFGDGTPILSTSDPEIVHTYQRSAGASHEVKVTGTGPGSCESRQTVHVSLPEGAAPCPVLGDLTLTKKGTSTTSYEVSAELGLHSGKPDRYEWNWGDGSPTQETLQPKATHTFTSESAPKQRQIKVRALGPGACESSALASVTVPGQGVKDPWCTLWPLLVAWFGSIAAGGWLVCSAANVDPAPSGWLSPVVFVLILIFGAAVYLWQHIGIKRGCPPDVCGGLSVGWPMMLTMTGVAFFLQECLPNWMFWGIGTFVLAGIFAGFWFAKCALKAGAGRFFQFFLIFLLAFAFVALLLARPGLDCV